MLYRVCSFGDENKPVHPQNMLRLFWCHRSVVDRLVDAQNMCFDDCFAKENCRCIHPADIGRIDMQEETAQNGEDCDILHVVGLIASFP